MRIAATLFIFAALTSTVSAACFGSGTLRTCYDNSGNSYTVNRLGNTTITNGYNSQTGSTWSQNSTTMGNTTFHSGQAANGNSWNATQNNFGKWSNTYGTDSRGNSFSSTCGPLGCSTTRSNSFGW